MNLHQYLLKIKNNKAINLDRFVLLLPAQYEQQWRSIFSSQKDRTNKNNHNLTIINPQTFNIMLESTRPSANRIEASDRGNSHKESTSFSFLLLFHQALFKQVVFEQAVFDQAANVSPNKEENTCPDAVVISDNGMKQNFTPKKHLLIIENQENFFRWSAFLSVLTQLGINNKDSQQYTIKENFSLADFDIAFGSGNNITNAKNIIFFKQYQHITCVFDYDLGGLTIFKSLSNLCSNIDKITLTFLQPEKTYLLTQAFTEHYFKKEPKSDKQWQQAKVLATALGFNELAQAFNETKKFMEQESYLSDPLESRAPINSCTNK